MFFHETYSYDSRSEKLKKATKAAGAVVLAAAAGSGLIGLAYMGGKSSRANRAPMTRTMDQYPGVINQSPVAGEQQIAAAGGWKTQHPEVSRIVIEKVEEHYGHDPSGNPQEEAESDVQITFSDGQKVEMPGFGQSLYNQMEIPSLDKKITHLEEKLGMEGGNAVVINAAETKSVLDALDSSVDLPPAGE